MKTTYTAIITKIDDNNFVGQCLEVPAALTQGSSQQELLENLKDAISMIINVQEEQILKELVGKKTYRKKLEID